jgi:hypothetical protein
MKAHRTADTHCRKPPVVDQAPHCTRTNLKYCGDLRDGEQVFARNQKLGAGRHGAMSIALGMLPIARSRIVSRAACRVSRAACRASRRTRCCRASGNWWRSAWIFDSVVRCAMLTGGVWSRSRQSGGCRRRETPVLDGRSPCIASPGWPAARRQPVTTDAVTSEVLTTPSMSLATAENS